MGIFRPVERLLPTAELLLLPFEKVVNVIAYIVIPILRHMFPVQQAQH